MFLLIAYYVIFYMCLLFTLWRMNKYQSINQYYLNNGDHSVFVLLLDASRAFDKVSFKRLFKILLDRNVCPRIIKVLLYMHMNKKCHVK